jgi:hypothetical protein
MPTGITHKKFFRRTFMKKYCLAAVLVFGVLFQAYTQTRPFIGYDQVAWGASVEDVRNAYNLGNDIVLRPSNTADPNIGVLIQENVSESIRQRDFYFNKYKTGNYQLYRVWVTYSNHSDANRDTLLGLLEQRYGNRTNRQVQSGQNGAIIYDSFIYTFGRFAPDIEVELHHQKGTVQGYESRVGYGSLELLIVYTWKGFRDEYLASQLGF